MENILNYFKKRYRNIAIATATTMLVISLFIPHSQAINESPTFWQFASADTMKYSRDTAGNPDSVKLIPRIIKEATDVNPTHISIATPYDEQFYPVLNAWVLEVRKYNKKVWFRGNFSSWEGWFGYTKFSDIYDHNKMTRAFILNHKDLFEDGDIVTPVPEPENGGLGDPRTSGEIAVKFNDFLVSSYQNCNKAFEEINKKVTCGYFSMNADVAKQVLNETTVKGIGNVIAIDHYVADPMQMEKDIDYLSQKYDAKIVLGEYGAPIPDINGQMTEVEQADFIGKLLNVLYLKREKIIGINYWVSTGGSTALINDDGNPRMAAEIVKNYYLPPKVGGIITDPLGSHLKNVVIKDKENMTLATTDNDGNFSFAILKGSSLDITISNENYSTVTKTVSSDENNSSLSIILIPKNPDFLYILRYFFSHLQGK